MATSKILYMKDCGSSYHGKHLKAALDYIMDWEKTQEGRLIGGVNFSDLKVTLPRVVIPGVEQMKPATINYGNFIQTFIDFIIIAFCVFLLVKAINVLTRKKKEEPAAPPVPSNEEKLLTEIRDLLKDKK